LASRPVPEGHVRRRLMALPNVRVIGGNLGMRHNRAEATPAGVRAY
jgi:hypothetical protein